MYFHTLYWVCDEKNIGYNFGNWFDYSFIKFDR